METLILRGGRKLTPEATCEFKRAYCVYRSALNTLADLAVQKKEAKYHMRPKVHFMGHTVWHYLRRNPKYLWYTLMRI